MEESDRTIKRRMRLKIMGTVQGVGFRPFVYRLAQTYGLCGWIENTPVGVTLELEGSPTSLQQCLLSLERDRPAHSNITSLETTYLDSVHYSGFEIRSSSTVGPIKALILPDIATCAECRAEIFDPTDRRYLYPFTNCTHCGPRFSIIERLPYDRQNTSMKNFRMCSACQREYDDPRDRRFHAQPNACPVCGPRLELWDKSGQTLARDQQSLEQVIAALEQGLIVALKGLGGFQFVVNAASDQAINHLRDLKSRDRKPFALMVPNLEMAHSLCVISELEARLLTSPEAPIVLLRKRTNHNSVSFSTQIAPDNPYLGLMLPYTPLHHILMHLWSGPLVMTSGNLKDETICIDEDDALKRFAGIADLFLVHNRPIVRHIDDSIVRLVRQREYVLRRARGFAPLPVITSQKLPPLLAVGAHLKNTVAFSDGPNVFVSQHIGDLETEQSYQAFQNTLEMLTRLYDATPVTIACDLHPDYLSTRWAEKMATQKQIELVRVQHHLAHVLACMAENELVPPFIGVAWDGTGYGSNQTIWGGEFFLITTDTIQRFAHFRTFPLVGGEQAIREPRRSALGLLFEQFGQHIFENSWPNIRTLDTFSEQEKKTMRHMLEREINCPRTSSVGRLFDAIASLIGLKHWSNFEGQAAMALEYALPEIPLTRCYPVEIQTSGPMLIVDWEPVLLSLLADLDQDVSLAQMSASFHNWLIEVLVRIIKSAKVNIQPKIVLTGGCFQNTYLIENALIRLEQEGFLPYCHQRVPTNDGGISLGQIIAATRKDKGTICAWQSPAK